MAIDLKKAKKVNGAEVHLLLTIGGQLAPINMTLVAPLEFRPSGTGALEAPLRSKPSRSFVRLLSQVHRPPVRKSAGHDRPATGFATGREKLSAGCRPSELPAMAYGGFTCAVMFEQALRGGVTVAPIYERGIALCEGRGSTRRSQGRDSDEAGILSATLLIFASAAYHR